MKDLRISIIQTDISWENKQDNLRLLHKKLQALCGTTEIVVLPEMFSTGFSMNSRILAETADGETITTLKQWATTYGMAIAGSYIALETNGKYYNRGFFLTPEGETHYYDKRHLFRMGQESEYFSSGEAPKQLITYRGWNIRLLICYDLRFPVWSRNVAKECDLLIYVASWPVSRRLVWDTLLRARALENMCYVCGVNRIGTDGNQLYYDGGSILYSPKGEALTAIPNAEETIATTTLSLSSLEEFREKFPVWKDADNFELCSALGNKC
ncbi:amidohydrolase [Bacteroides sp.]|uniref:amidohydrolase n=1 Tax=Bacteroides sp. TaxID=29523 RepID=UPI001B6BB85B|nr:amidohydrolase [Bacteroides sp.]MBP6064632.1 amidohydrolase [Bacteroides sp.]MBP6066973.1 amidohydrolase [Bacteroides sp.]MBP6935857.1 amidohydrolase [Bacteroides sp.]MBP8622227.1 amidohydrolase [Bacteroides sp.]MBP9585566.1 amidohydrolase [Bacteroides sp.]